DDGVTVHVALSELNQLRGADFDWQVPGLRAERVEALVRSLPKALRRNLVPVPDTVAAVLARVRPGQEPMLYAVARELSRVAGELDRRHEDGAVVGYPALVDEGDSVAVRVLSSPDEQHEAHWAGVRRLLLLRIPVARRVLRDRLSRRAGLALAANPYGSADAL